MSRRKVDEKNSLYVRCLFSFMKIRMGGITLRMKLDRHFISLGIKAWNGVNTKCCWVGIGHETPN